MVLRELLARFAAVPLSPSVSGRHLPRSGYAPGANTAAAAALCLRQPVRPLEALGWRLAADGAAGAGRLLFVNCADAGCAAPMAVADALNGHE